jgi:hypothetical protein
VRGLWTLALPADSIRDLARLSVLRAAGFASLAIVMAMMGSMHDVALALRIGACGYLILGLCLGYAAARYPRRRRIDETEVWIMLAPEKRPALSVARGLIVAAMQGELYEKALWSSLLAAGLIGASGVVLLVRAVAP